MTTFPVPLTFGGYVLRAAIHAPRHTIDTFVIVGFSRSAQSYTTALWRPERGNAWDAPQHGFPDYKAALANAIERSTSYA